MTEQPDHLIVMPTIVDDPDGNPIGTTDDADIPAGIHPVGVAHWAGPGDHPTVTISFDDTHN